MSEKPADDVKDVHQEPDKSDTNRSGEESPEGAEQETAAEMAQRHETLHGEHRERLDEHDEMHGKHEERLSALEKHLGLRSEEHRKEAREKARKERHEAPRERKRH